MSPREDRRQNLADDRRLSDNGFAEFILHESAVVPELLQNITEIPRLGRAGRRTGWLLGRCTQIKCGGKSYRKRRNLFYGINHFPARELAQSPRYKRKISVLPPVLTEIDLSVLILQCFSSIRFMSLSSFDQFLLDDDADCADDPDDFDVDFDEDYECLSDEEFEVCIEFDEYDANDRDIPEGAFCLDDDMDGFGDFDAPEDLFAEKDDVEVE